MGCSNARLLVQAPMTGESGAAGATNPLSPSLTVATSPVNVATDTNNTSTRMHLTGVDLVVERNGSYTLLLTPKTHKQLMPYVLRKKRFRILVDKPRSDPTNEPIIMENNKEIKSTTKKDKKSKQNPMESTIESMQQVASNELEKAQTRILGGRSIDRGNPEDEDEYIQSDDEGMIEEIVTTVEQDKDLECKVKKKIETKKTTAQHPETHNTITKVVKTEVTEITRTITINDHHDLERAKRELGIDDVNRLLPSSSWIDQSRSTQIKEKRYEPMNEIVTSKDFPSDSPKQQTYPSEKTILSESTTVGRGPVTETISSSEPKPIEIKKKKKKSKLCSCTRSAAVDDEEDKQKVITTSSEPLKQTSVVSTPVIQSVIDLQIQGEQLISSDIKQLIIDKKFLLIEYIHSKIFSPSKLFASNEQDAKARKISSRILDLLRYDRCSSWTQMYQQLTDEYTGYSPANTFLQPMLNTYENLFTKKQANLLNTFSTIHQENDIKDIQENHEYLNLVQTQIHQPNIEIIPKQSVEDTVEQVQQTIQEEQVVPAAEIIQEEQIEKVINDDEHPIKELTMPDNTQEPLAIYNEEYLIKMLGDISPHKPTTLAEAIAYQYIDLEDPKLGLSNETIQRLKNLFRPLSDPSTSNVIRVKRSGEYLTDVNLSETNPFEKLTETEPFIYQLQPTFEPTLDFNEKQFRSLTETILNNKTEYDQLQFDIARTSLPIYDLKESSTNDFSQSDSGYSMTTATHESLASKIKIEFEPINQEIGSIPPKRDDIYDEEKIDLDKATQEQLDKHELNQDLIQIIKSDFNGSDKTIGQAILSRELRLDSTDPSDISHLNSLGIHKEQARILTAFFFPKHTRIIAYSPEPGRFVEAQTTFNPEYPGYKTDTTIIQIQEKQLSSDHLAMQRNIHDDRTAQRISIEPEQTTPVVVVAATSPKDKTPPPTPSVFIKKRKSDGSGGLLSCFKSKKPKPGTEQQGQPTVLTTQTSVQQQTTKTVEEKPMIDYSILPDGKRIYIDAFRDRPGLDMSYKPNDFENRFVLPVTKPASEYERPITPEIERKIVQTEPIHSEVQQIESKPHIHLEPRPATIEPVDVQSEPKPIVIPRTKSEDKTVTKKPVTIDLHGAAVNLPKIELVEPGPLPTLPITKEKKIKKVKKSTGGLCASCFGAKAAEKKKQDIVSETIQTAPIEQKKPSEEVKKDLTPIIESSPVPSPTTDQPILPRVNIDIFKERNFQKNPEALPKPEERVYTAIEKTIPVVEPHYQSPSSEPAPLIPKDTSIFSKVNIDTFKERTFQKNSETLPKSIVANETVPPSTSFEEPHYQLPTNEPILTPKDSSIFSQVNIDIFKERTFQTTSQSLPKPEEPHYEFPCSEPVPLETIPIENEYSIPEQDTYDIPRTIETSPPPSFEIKTEEKIIKNEMMIPPTTDIQKSSGDFHPTEPIKDKEISPIKTEILPNVELKKTKIKKGSLTLPIKKKKSKEPKVKSNLFSSIFRSNQHKSKIPALDLPSVERDLSPNNPLRLPHRHDSDPLHIPSIDLPKLDLPLPTYDRPEVNMSTGQIKQSSEFSIPVIDFPPIPNLPFPETNKQSIDINSDLMKIPNIRLPSLQFILNKQEDVKSPPIELTKTTEEIPVQSTIETGLALSSPVDDMLGIQTDHKNFPIETDYAINTEPIIVSSLTTQITEISGDQQVTIIDTHLVQSSEVPLIIEKPTIHNYDFQLPSPEPVLTLPKQSQSPPPSFDDDVPSPPSKIVPAIKSPEKQQPIETKTHIKKKSSTLALCSCFGNKSAAPKDKTQTIAAPKSSLPTIDMPLPSSNISSTLKTKGPLRAPSTNLPPVDLTSTSTEIVTIHKQQTEAVVPSIEQSPTPPPILEEPKNKSDISTTVTQKQPIEEIKTKKSPSFEIKAPVMNIPQVDLSGPPKSEAYLSLSKQEETTSIPEQIQSRSDSGLEAITASQVHPSSTFGTHTTIGDIQQHPSVSSGFGSEILDNMTTKGYSLPGIELPEPTLVPKVEIHLTKHDFTRKINMNDEIHAKLLVHEHELKTRLESEISKSINDFDSKKDQKSLNKILTHAIDLIKDKKVTTYPELKQKLTIEHKTEAFMVDPVVHSLYYTFEKHGLDNLDKPEFPLAIRDMVRLPAKQTYDTVTHLNKESASLTTTEMTKETIPETARSCLTCGRSKSKTKLPPSPTTTTTISTSGLLDERRRVQLNTHRNELGTILRDHIQSSQPPIRKFADHPKEIEKIIRKSLTLVNQPKIVSYEQMRNDLKTEYKQTYYLIDPIIDIIRDTFDHCDITQLTEKTNLDILDSNISQTANLYNHQIYLLTSEEHNALKSNQLSWLQSYLINNESNEKKITRKQRKELNKILQRTLEILSTNLITTWDELALQLHREFPKANDLCNRAIELIKQSQTNGLFQLQQAPPIQDKRRASFLITERARQNLKTNRNKIILSFKTFLTNYNQSSNDEQQLESYLNKTFNYLEEQKPGQFKSYDNLKEQLKKDFKKSHQDKLIEQIVDIIEQAHATNQFDDIDKPEVQTLMKDRLDGKPLILKEMYVSLPPRVGAYGDDSFRYSSASNGDRTTTSHRVGRGLSWREANERARILFYRGKHPAIHYDEQAAAFDVRMLLETASGGTQEIPVTDSDVHELLNSCGVQWDGVNIVSLVDHSEDVVRAAEQAALKVIREKGMVDLRAAPPPSTNNDETIN